MKRGDVRFGVRLPPMPIDGGRRLLDTFCERAERANVDSLWVSDRFVPVKGYLRFAETEPLLDPFTTLAYVAARTSRILLGTGVIIAPLRHPLVLAKSAATVQHLSDGRLILGLGTGWAPEEFNVLGVSRSERGARTNEVIKILRQAFSNRAIDCSGEFFKIENVRLDPPCAHTLPIWGSGGPGASDFANAGVVGTLAPAVIQRLARLDGWLTRPTATVEEIRVNFSRITDEADRLGRDPEQIELAHVNFGHLVDGKRRRVVAEQSAVFASALGTITSFERQSELHWVGSVAEVAERVQGLLDAGVRHIVFHPLRPDVEQIDLFMESVVSSLSFDD